MEKKQAELDSLENSGQWLIEHSDDDSKVAPDIHTKISNVRTSLDKLLSKIQARQARLDKVLFESQEFNVAFETFMEKLVAIEEAVAKQRPVSAVYDTVKEQSKDNKVLLNRTTYTTHVKISQLVNKMCSQQACSKLINKL